MINQILFIMKNLKLSLFALSFVLQISAQDTFTYRGESICFSEHTFKSTLVASLQGVEKQSYQGMDVYGQTMTLLRANLKLKKIRPQMRIFCPFRVK